MKDLENNQLREIEGGSISIWGIAGCIALAIFIFGVIDGYVRPLRCN